MIVRDSHEFTISASSQSNSESSASRSELDSHADTTVGGANCVLLSGTGEFATVHSFSDERKPFQNVPIGTVATAWVVPETGETIILIFNEALFFGDRLDHSLLCPNQMRAHGIVVSDTPMQFDQQSTHSIYVPDENLVIPLALLGIISNFESHKPSNDELVSCRRAIMTGDIPWNPNDLAFAQQERVVLTKSKVSAVLKNGDINDGRGSPDSVSEVSRFDIVPEPAELLQDDELAKRFISAVNIAGDDWNGDGLDGYADKDLFPMNENRRSVFSMSRGERRSIVTKEALARRWGTGMNTTHRTMLATTQRGLRTFIHPTDRRVSTKKPHLGWAMMPGKKMYSDTIIASDKSIRQNKVAQNWSDGEGYSLFYPCDRKRMLRLLFP